MSKQTEYLLRVVILNLFLADLLTKAEAQAIGRKLSLKGFGRP